MKTFHWKWSLPGLALLVGMTVSCLNPTTSPAAEFHFVIHDVEGDAAAWSPREVVIHKRSVLDEKLVFVLANPTARTHVFEAPGLFEQILEGPEARTVKPLRVYVTSGETLHVQISVEQWKRRLGANPSEAESYEFFCPLHGPEEELRSTIRVVP